MKLWLILYAGTHIGGTWDPLPYDMKECEARAAQLQASTDAVIASGVSPTGEKFKTWRLSCEYRAVRPSLGEKSA